MTLLCANLRRRCVPWPLHVIVYPCLICRIPLHITVARQRSRCLSQMIGGRCFILCSSVQHVSVSASSLGIIKESMPCSLFCAFFFFVFLFLPCSPASLLIVFSNDLDFRICAGKSSFANRKQSCGSSIPRLARPQGSNPRHFAR